MINAMGYLLGLAVLCCVPAMAGEWVQEGADSFSGGLFSGTEIDSLGRVSLASFRGVNLALDAVASSGGETLTIEFMGYINKTEFDILYDFLQSQVQRSASWPTKCGASIHCSNKTRSVWGNWA